MTQDAAPIGWGFWVDIFEKYECSWYTNLTLEIAQRLTFADLTVKAEFAKPAPTLRRLNTTRL